MAECGCTTHYFPESRKWAIYYCSRHAVGPKLWKAVQQIIDWNDNLEEFGPCPVCHSDKSDTHRDGCMIGQWTMDIGMAIAAAEGRKS